MRYIISIIMKNSFFAVPILFMAVAGFASDPALGYNLPFSSLTPAKLFTIPVCQICQFDQPIVREGTVNDPSCAQNKPFRSVRKNCNRFTCSDNKAYYTETGHTYFLCYDQSISSACPDNTCSPSE